MTETGPSLTEQIDMDLKKAMREKDDVAKLTLRSVKTALTEAAKSGTQAEQNQNDVQAVIQREAKKRRDAAAEYERVGATERAADELAELAILERYLPRQLSEAEIEQIVRNIIEKTGASSMQDMGRVMSAVMAEVQGTADGKLVNQVVRKQLSQ